MHFYPSLPIKEQKSLLLIYITSKTEWFFLQVSKIKLVFKVFNSRVWGGGRVRYGKEWRVGGGNAKGGLRP